MNEDFDLEEIKKLIGYGEEQTPQASPGETARGEAAPSRRARREAESAHAAPRPERVSSGKSEDKPERPDRSAGLRRSTVAFSLPFLLCLAVISVISWCIPLRPTVSYTENRNLAVLPDFSFEKLLSGELFSGVDEWFSDTFPYRDSWIALGNDIESLYGKAGIAIVGDIVQAEPEPTEAPKATQKPASPGETAVPEPTEAEPEHENSAKELDEIDISNDLAASSSTIVLDGSVYPIGKFSEKCSGEFAELMNKAAELLEGKARVFVMPAMQSTSVMLSRSVRDYCQCPPDEDTLDYMYSLMDDGVYTVNTYEALVKHNDEYLYFHSDHHWTARGAYYAYLGWAEAAGAEPVTIDKYVETDTGDYTGGYYGYSTKQHPVEMDRVFTYTPPGDVKLTIIDSDTSDSLDYRGFNQKLITPIENNGTNGKYSAFLAGDHAMCTLINNDIKDESAVLIVKDSYGNPLGYYFTQNYKYVYLIDYRTYFNRRLVDFVDYYDVDDVIFTMNIYMTQVDDGVSCIRSFVR